MKIACATTSQLPSETANSIQALMACDGLRRCGEEIHLYVPGSGTISFDKVREFYGMHCEPFPISYINSNPRLQLGRLVLYRLSYFRNSVRVVGGDGFEPPKA